MRKRSIKNVERIELPREKMLKYGADKLADAELLAILLRTGTEDMNVLQVAAKLFKQFPGTTLAQAGVEELIKVKGVGQVKALEIIACFELGRRLLKDKKAALILQPRHVWERMAVYRQSKKEHFVVFFLDTQNQLEKEEIVSVGTLNESIIHPREVFEPAIRHLASHIIVAHNHPSGGLEPSSEDRVVTNRLQDAGRLLGIQLLDHVIVTAQSYYSFKEHNDL